MKSNMYKRHRIPCKQPLPFGQRLCAWLMMILLGAMALVYALTAEAEPAQHAHLPEGLPWATVIQTAPTHEGPGLRYAMNGSIPVGSGVEVLCEQDGWVKCWYHTRLDKPVWVSAEYLDFEE